MRHRHYTIKQIYYGTILGLVSFPILLKAAVFGLFGKKMTFVVTTKGQSETMPQYKLWPYYLMILLNIISIIFGIIRILNGEDFFAMSINMFWAVYHIFILQNIFLFNKIIELNIT